MLELVTAPVVALLSDRLGLPATDLNRLLAPPKAGSADLALGCFQPAKAKGVAPPALAAELAAAVNASGLALAQAAGPFLNLTFTASDVAQALLPALAADPALALRSRSGAGRTVCLDFSSPNIAKRDALGELVDGLPQVRAAAKKLPYLNSFA